MKWRWEKTRAMREFWVKKNIELLARNKFDELRANWPTRISISFHQALAEKVEKWNWNFYYLRMIYTRLIPFFKKNSSTRKNYIFILSIAIPWISPPIEFDFTFNLIKFIYLSKPHNFHFIFFDCIVYACFINFQFEILTKNIKKSPPLKRKFKELP